LFCFIFLWICYYESRLRFDERQQIRESLYLLSVPFFRSLAESGPAAL
jgi:hypothetical protein